MRDELTTKIITYENGEQAIIRDMPGMQLEIVHEDVPMPIAATDELPSVTHEEAAGIGARLQTHRLDITEKGLRFRKRR